MTKFQITIILFSLFAACSLPEKTNNDGFGTDKKAHWIEDGRSLPASDSLFYLDNPSPLFRKEFKTEKNIDNAKLCPLVIILTVSSGVGMSRLE